MKKISAMMLGASLLLGACDKKDLEPVLQPGAAPSITAPAAGAAFVLSEGTANQVFSPFSWTKADFGFAAGVNYTLELDKAGNNFADAVTVGSVNALGISDVTQEKINNILLSKDLPGEEDSNVEFRVVARLGSDPSLPTLVSQPVTVKVRPYTVVIVYPQLQVPGNYQSPNAWDPANNSTVIFSARSDERYEGYIYFPISNVEYKFTKGPSWTTNWGDDGGNGTLESNGANIKAAQSGVYRLNVDLNSLTHAAVRTEWGVIGSATPNGWDSDQNMTYDPAANKWVVTLPLTQGEIKFRANDAWDINLGDNAGNRKLQYGGSNIPVAEAGTYSIELNLGGAIYTYKLTKI